MPTEIQTSNVNLVSQEGDELTVSIEAAKMSELISTMIDEDQTDDEECQQIPLPNVKAATLARIIEFCKQHHNKPLPEIEKPLKSKNIHDIVPAWDAEFVDMPQEQIFEIICAANYLDIKQLLDLACAKVASMIKGKTPEEIRSTFNIVNDFTPEEEAQVREENKWCEEA